MRRDDECGITVKWNNGGGWSSDGVVLWLGRIQNRDAVEWWIEWSMLRWYFYNSGGWESRRSEKDGLRQWCRFNALVLARDGRQRKEALLEDKTNTPSSSWLNGKKVWHVAAAWQCRSVERWHRWGEIEETIPVGLTRILLI
jgi:hypothetical protein